MAQLTNRDDYMRAMNRGYEWYRQQHPDDHLQNMPFTYSKKQMTDDAWWWIGDVWNETTNERIAVHWEPKSDRVRVGRSRQLREKR